MKSSQRLAFFYTRHFKKVPQQSRSRALVHALLVSTLEAFSRGSEHLVLNAIAKRAGVGIGSLYDYFDGEGDILAVALAKLTEDNLARFEETLRGTESLSLREMVFHVVDSAFTMYLQNTRLPRAALRVAHQAGLMPMLAEGQSVFASSLAKAFARRTDVNATDIDAASYAITHAVMGLVIALVWDDRKDWFAIRNSAVDMIVGYITRVDEAGFAEESHDHATVTERCVDDGVEPFSARRLFPMYKKYFKKVPTQARSIRAVLDLLEEVQRILTERGDAFSVSSMEKRPGLKVASIYDYFQTGVDVTASAIGVAADTNLDAFEAALSSVQTDSLESAVARIVALAFTIYTRDPRFARVAYTLAHRLELMPILLEGRALFCKRLVSEMKLRASVTKDQLNVRAFVVTHSVMGVVHARIWEREPSISNARAQAACAALVLASLQL
jgi:AcrR family transcriptional regulator